MKYSINCHNNHMAAIYRFSGLVEVNEATNNISFKMNQLLSNINTKVFYICVLCLMHITVLGAIQSKKYASKLTISDGMSDNGVTSLFKDSKGYLWLGTYNGLNRYDGYDFEIFKNTPDKKILSGNRIRSFAEDANGNIWIGTEQGVCVYDYSMEELVFIHHPEIKDEVYIIRDIVVSTWNNKIYCSTENNGMLIYNDDYSFYKHVTTGNKLESFKSLVLNDSTLLYATSKGLLQFNIASESYSSEPYEEAGKCTSLIRLSKNNLLVASAKGAVVIGITESGDLTYKKGLWKDKNFITAYRSASGELWLGTLHAGLWYVKDYKTLLNNRIEVEMVEDISRVSSIIPSFNNDIWLGSFDEGLFRFSSMQNAFNYFGGSQVSIKDFNINNITQITAVDSNSVYLAGPFQNYAKLNVSTQQFNKALNHRMSNTSSEPFNYGFVDSRGDQWIRNGFKGVTILNKEGKVKRYLNSSIYPSLKDVRAFTEDKKGNMWIACDKDIVKVSIHTNGDLLGVKSLQDDHLLKHDQISHINNIYADPLYNYIWVTTYYDGLFRIKLNDQTYDVAAISQYVNKFGDRESISSNFVTAIVRLANKQLWIGTEGGGVCKVINSDGDLSFKTYTEKNGLSNNIVRNILAEGNKLWISTNNGLTRLDTDHETFRVFTSEDGLPFESFRIGAAKLDNGVMLFSGYEGLLYFNPTELTYKKKLPKFEFGDLSVFNVKIHPGDTISKRVILHARLNEIESIKLKYDENVFSVETVPLHFSDPQSYFIRYQLLPINKQWITQSSSQRYISFNGLQPGEYELKVMVGNRLDKWTELKSLKISIQPPWWQMNLVRVLFVLAIVGIAWFLIRMRFRFMQLNHSVEIEQIEKSKVKEVNAAKLRFFSNISHEIKTPLTLISVPVGILMDRFKEQPDVKEKLDIVQRQSLKIAKLVDQVHDFQRSDANLLKLENQHFGFDIFINDLVKEFDFMAHIDQKNLSVRGESDIYVWADKDKLEKVLNNLLNNAFKFTDKGDDINIDFKREGKNLIVSIQDSGKGIGAEDLPYIFERFYQAKKTENVNKGGSGIGLAFSKKLVEMHYGSIQAKSTIGEGTTITMQLPIVKQEDIELIKEKEEGILEVEKGYVSYSFLSGNQDAEHIRICEEIKGASIFVAEDNTDLRNFIGDTLGKYFKICLFKNGAELLATLEKEWPDIIVSDVLMPEVTGFELCRQLKSDIKTSHIPIVLLTACATVEDQIKGLEDGADLYIKKPFNIQHLVSGIESLLKSREQLQKRFRLEVPLKRQNKDDDNNNAFLVKLYALMDENLSSTDIDLDSFAEKLYLNRTFFYQKVKALTNQTPFELLKTYRIKKAADLLLNEQMSVMQVYDITGFKSRAHFNKVFKDNYGTTPSQYAQKAKEVD